MPRLWIVAAITPPADTGTGMAPISPSIPRTAMILAAGRGERMRPLTDATPKPMLKAGGAPLIARILDRLAAARVARVVVNTHHLADQIEAFLAEQEPPPEILVSRETERPLETGGGVRHALSLLGDDPVIVCNGDAIWLNGPVPVLTRMAEAWDPARMDALLLTMLAPRVIGPTGPGDFGMNPDGLLRRREGGEILPYIYASVQIIKPQVFEDAPDGPFSMNVIWDRLIERERLYGLVHDGLWFHLNTPEDLAEADPMLDERNARWLEL